VALAGAGLERFAQEIRNLQRTEVREVEEPFATGSQKGSSAMPHKRNPITSERVCGLARVLRGYSQAGLENVALWHERDISHSGAERVILPDATILLDYMQHLATRLVEGMIVHPKRMRANLELTHGALFSQRALTALIESGMTRDEAYRLVQEAAQEAWDEGTPFRDLLGAAIAAHRDSPGREAEELTPVDLDAVLDPDAYLAHVPEVIARLERLG
jgi:adenylosuccinate lyase